MPNLVGLHYIEARNILQNLNNEYLLNLQIQMQEQESEEYIDHVIGTIPRYGASLGRGVTVRVTVGATQEVLPEPEPDMPDLIGVPYADARRSLQILNSEFALELDIRTQERVDEDQIDRVLEIVPRPGTALTRGATVIITIGVEPEIPMVTVPPNLVGLTRAALESVFLSLGLVPEVSLHDSEFPEGTVIFIDRVGDEVPEGTEIEVHISSGPPPPPPPPEVTTVAITFSGVVVTDFGDSIGTHTPLAVSIGPTGAEQGAEITWASSDANIVEVRPNPADPSGMTAIAVHMSPGWATITVTVNGVSTSTIARTRG
jgi:beta-lactam-binding protein with PASTA domain